MNHSMKYRAFILLLFIGLSGGSFGKTPTVCQDGDKTISARFESFQREELACMKKFGWGSLDELVREIVKNPSYEASDRVVGKLNLWIDDKKKIFHSDHAEFKAKLSNNLEWYHDAVDVKLADHAIEPYSMYQDYWKRDYGILSLCDNRECAIQDPNIVPKPTKNVVLDMEGMFSGAACSYDRKIDNDDCEARFTSALALHSAASVMQQVNSTLRSKSRKEAAAYLAKNEESWDIYIEEQPVMWWFDSLANNKMQDWFGCTGYRYGSNKKVDCHKYDENQNPVGIEAMPMGRWFFLHPEAVVSWAEEEPSGDHLKVGLAMQWVGWMYTRVKDGKMHWPVGISFVSVASDNAELKDIGYGAYINYGNHGLAVTKHGDEHLVSLNISLNSLIVEKKKSDYFRDLWPF